MRIVNTNFFLVIKIKLELVIFLPQNITIHFYHTFFKASISLVFADFFSIN